MTPRERLLALPLNRTETPFTDVQDAFFVAFGLRVREAMAEKICADAGDAAIELLLAEEKLFAGDGGVTN